MTKNKTKKGSRTPTAPANKIIEAALRLASATQWDEISLEKIAIEADVSENVIQSLFPSKLSILIAYSQQIDKEALARSTSISIDEPIKDRLFEAMMIRLDIMLIHKEAVRNIIRSTVPRNTMAVAAGVCSLRHSMRQILESCGDTPGGLRGNAKIQVLMLIYLNVLRVWLNDDSADTGKTMAILDKSLSHADSLIKWLQNGCLRHFLNEQP